MKKNIGNYICKVPNSPEGEYFIHLIKKYLADNVTVNLRGSNPDWKAAAKKGIKQAKRPGYFRHSVPIEFAKEIRIYCHEKLEKGKRGEVVGPRSVEAMREYRSMVWKNHHNTRNTEALVAGIGSALKMYAQGNCGL
jgi:hypothetical protein